MGKAEIFEPVEGGIYFISDSEDPLQIESNIYPSFPTPKEKKHVETLHAEPIDELLIRKPAKTAIKALEIKRDQKE